MCVLAGQLLYKLSLVGRSSESFTLSDKVHSFTSASGLNITLAQPAPPPLPNEHQPSAPYPVMLLINSN
jgi:hypothetical protein